MNPTAPIPFLHVLVIGAAGSPPSSNGQLPTLNNVLSFIREHQDKQCYFYFIDPRHYDIPGDQALFQAYQKADIAFATVARPFDFNTFHKEYKLDNEEALFVDYANLCTSEYEYTCKLGCNPDWYYCVPGCSGEQLDLNKIYIQAKSIPHYNIYKDLPVPTENISLAYKEDIMKDMLNLLNCLRYLPASSQDPRPPQWYVKQVGNDPNSWTVMRVQAYDILSHFFECNKVTTYNFYPTEEWTPLVRNILGLDLRVQPSATVDD